jgi:hypothetical protein
MNKEPKWTVLYNIVSRENARWIGMGWEFFDEEADAQKCYKRHLDNGNCPCKRPYFRMSDYTKLGAAHEEAYNLGAAAKAGPATNVQQAAAQKPDITENGDAGP